PQPRGPTARGHHGARGGDRPRSRQRQDQERPRLPLSLRRPHRRCRAAAASRPRARSAPGPGALRPRARAREERRRSGGASRARRVRAARAPQLPGMAASRGAANAVMARRAVAAALALAALGALAARSDAQSILDFITFDGIDYIRWAEEPGRALGPDDLGVGFAVVGCSFTGDRRGCPFGTDAAAAFMPTGSRIYVVKGYSTDFRLAAVWQEKIYLYQAWRNPRAKMGVDLYAVAGKVRAIDVQRGEPTWRRPAFLYASARRTMPT